ncbi:MAG: hypothetical protein Q9208_003612 [Pyrenodesmia sp. 3 TL-2023]
MPSSTSFPVRERMQLAFQEDPTLMANAKPPISNDEKARALLASSGVAGVALTLHRAHHLVKVDPDFLDGQDRQVINRVWRIGQDSKCWVWRFITADMFEEVIIRKRQEIRAYDNVRSLGKWFPGFVAFHAATFNFKIYLRYTATENGVGVQSTVRCQDQHCWDRKAEG